MVYRGTELSDRASSVPEHMPCTLQEIIGHCEGNRKGVWDSIQCAAYLRVRGIEPRQNAQAARQSGFIVVMAEMGFSEKNVACKGEIS